MLIGVAVFLVLVLIYVAPTAVHKINESRKEARLETLSEEAKRLTESGEYLEATEIIKEMTAIIEGRDYTRDPNPEETYELNREAESSSLFEQLGFSRVSVIWNSITGDLVGEITNNGDKDIEGYFAISFYDNSGNITYSRDSISIPGDGIRSGETIHFSVPVNKFEYSSFRVQDDALYVLD